MKIENPPTLKNFSKTLYAAYSNNEDVVIDKEFIGELYNQITDAIAVKENYDDFLSLKESVEDEIETAMNDTCRSLRYEIMNIISNSVNDVVAIKDIHL